MTKPLDPYSTTTLTMTNQLIDMKSKGVKLAELPPDKRPYDVKQMRNRFIHDVINYRILHDYKKLQAASKSRSGSPTTINPSLSAASSSLKLNVEPSSVSTAPELKPSSVPVGDDMRNSDNESLNGRAKKTNKVKLAPLTSVSKSVPDLRSHSVPNHEKAEPESANSSSAPKAIKAEQKPITTRSLPSLPSRQAPAVEKSLPAKVAPSTSKPPPAVKAKVPVAVDPIKATKPVEAVKKPSKVNGAVKPAAAATVPAPEKVVVSQPAPTYITNPGSSATAAVPSEADAEECYGDDDFESTTTPSSPEKAANDEFEAEPDPKVAPIKERDGQGGVEDVAAHVKNEGGALDSSASKEVEVVGEGSSYDGDGYEDDFQGSSITASDGGQPVAEASDVEAAVSEVDVPAPVATTTMPVEAPIAVALPAATGEDSDEYGADYENEFSGLEGEGEGNKLPQASAAEPASSNNGTDPAPSSTEAAAAPPEQGNEDHYGDDFDNDNEYGDDFDQSQNLS
jgi:hypothetical protein